MTINESKGRILFVNSEQNINELMTQELKATGYEVVHIRCLTEAIQVVKETQFELILLDWLFEDGTGMDLCQAIRQIDDQTPILFYMDEGQPSEMVQAIQAGAQGIFISPFDVGTFIIKQ